MIEMIEAIGTILTAILLAPLIIVVYRMLRTMLVEEEARVEAVVKWNKGIFGIMNETMRRVSEEVGLKEKEINKEKDIKNTMADKIEEKASKELDKMLGK